MVDYYLSRHVDGPLNENLADQRDFLAPLFQDPSIYSMLTYDAVMALGIAVCQSSKEAPSGPELFETLEGIVFLGATGRVAFNNDTGTRQSVGVQFQVINLFAAAGDITLRSVKSLVIDLANGTVEELVPLVFPDGSTTPPSSLPPVEEEMNLVSLKIRGSAWGLAGLSIALSIYCAVWTYLHRDKPRVRASQPVFLFILCVGTFFMGSAIIPATWQEPMSQEALNVGCMLDIWLLSVGFATAFAALFSKTWRINQVYAHAQRFQRVEIRAKDVVLPFAVLFTTNIVLLTAWTIVDPLGWERLVIKVDAYNRTTESRGTCLDFSDTDQAERIFG